MMLSVNFNHNLELVDNEVRNVRTDRRLPSDMYAIPAPKFTKLGPQLSLAIRHVSAQAASPWNNFRIDASWHDRYPHPDPSPQGGGGR